MADGLTVSRLIIGLWQIADLERRGRLDLGPPADRMGDYVGAGLTTFDMADHYGSAELISGRFAEVSPGKAEFLTKWVPEPGPYIRGAARKAVHRALRRMGRRSIHLLQYHAWKYDDPIWLDHMFELAELREEGLIRHLGVTNFDSAHLRMLLETGVPISTNQVCYSLIDSRARGAMSEVCRRYGVGILAYGTLAGGLLTERGLTMPDIPPSQMPSWSLMKYRRQVDAAGGWDRFRVALEALVRISRKQGASPAHVATRYVLDSPEVAAVIVGSRLDGSRSPQDSLGIFDLHLSHRDRLELDAAFGVLDSLPGDCGDEYRRPPFITAAGDLSHHLGSFSAPYPTIKGKDGRTRVLSGTKWEKQAGYARAVRVGNRIMVSGTTATHGDRVVGGRNLYSQTHFCIDKVEGAIRSLGGKLEDIVRTRLFVADMSQWAEAARAHGERLREVQPVNTLVGAELVGTSYLVEMEAEALVDPK